MNHHVHLPVLHETESELESWIDQHRRAPVGAAEPVGHDR